MHAATHGLLLALSNVLLPVACLIFASGFFPYKPFIPGFAAYPQPDLAHPQPPAQFDKVIFMVVDALRSDFVFSHSSGFEFTHSLINEGKALPFTAHATAPTVTMPRVKAITTGSIPSFLDMILNFAESDTSSSLATQDTWLSQMKSKNTGKLLMFGDDTWLKLFPGTFDRADGTSSFFVSDFTEVDNNVTRHIPGELQNADWSVMVMHYLGMDHIGHKSGPRSANMIPKQKEMDDIVKQIYSAMEREQHLRSTVLILCGDHGMNDGGNHGGSAPGETSPALVFISPKLQTISDGLACPTSARRDFEFYNTIEQSDIAPTLAGLLGFPVPLNNLGVFVEQILGLWVKESDQVELMFQNAQQMLKVVEATFPHAWYADPSVILRCSSSSSARDILACGWKGVLENFNASEEIKHSHKATLDALIHFCKTAQQSLSSTASNYNVPNLFIGIFLSLIATVLALSVTTESLKLPSSSTGLFYTVMLGAYSCMMFASSYVEEEHQYWYWIASVWMVFQSAKISQRSLPLVWAAVISLRLQRRWQQSGQKHAGASDIAGHLSGRLSPVLWLLVIATFLDLGGEISLRTLGRAGLGRTAARTLAAFLTMGGFVFKLCFTSVDEPELLMPESTLSVFGSINWCQGLNLISMARFVFLAIGATVLFITSQKALCVDTLQPLLNLLLITQTRVANIPLFLLYNIQLRQLRRSHLSTTAIAVTSLIFAHVSFFCMGNTNSISSLDLSNAYNGISSYNPVPVGILLYLGNWAGPIWWSFAGLLLNLEQHGQQRRAKDDQQERAHYEGDGETSTSSGTNERTSRSNESSESTISKNTTESMSKPATELQPSKEPKLNPTNTTSISHTYTRLHIYLIQTSIHTLFISTAVLSVMVACTMLRTHLFVWTVFSPKFLYVVAWMSLWHLLGNVLLGGFFAWLG